MIHVRDDRLRTIPSSPQRGVIALIGIVASTYGAFQWWGGAGAFMCVGVELLAICVIDAAVERFTFTRFE